MLFGVAPIAQQLPAMNSGSWRCSSLGAARYQLGPGSHLLPPIGWWRPWRWEHGSTTAGACWQRGVAGRAIAYAYIAVAEQSLPVFWNLDAGSSRHLDVNLCKRPDSSAALRDLGGDSDIFFGFPAPSLLLVGPGRGSPIAATAG